MATIGNTDYYYYDVKLLADGSATAMIQMTRDGGSNPAFNSVTSSEHMQVTRASLVPFVLQGNGYDLIMFTPIHALALEVAVQKGELTAAQLKTWYDGSDSMMIGAVKGATAFDYYAGTPIPTPKTIVTDSTLNIFNTTDPLTHSVIQAAIETITPTPVTPIDPVLPTLSANQITVEKMYLAAFLRAPELGGLNYWSNMLDTGSSISHMGDVIFSLPIVKNIYSDAMTNTQFITAIYNNIFSKTPDAEGLAYWKSSMDGGMHRGDLVMTMIEAGLSTPVGTLGRDAIHNRLDAAHYAAQVQVKNNLELGVNFLLEQTHKQGVDTAALTQYQSDLNAHVVTLIGAHAAPDYAF